MVGQDRAVGVESWNLFKALTASLKILSRSMFRTTSQHLWAAGSSLDVSQRRRNGVRKRRAKGTHLSGRRISDVGNKKSCGHDK